MAGNSETIHAWLVQAGSVNTNNDKENFNVKKEKNRPRENICHNYDKVLISLI